MANEKTFEILKEMKADPKAKELYEGMEKTNSPEEMVTALAQIAGKLGYDITAEDIKEAMEQEDARKKAQTDKAVADMEALEDDDLEDVAGGEWIAKQPNIYTVVFYGSRTVFNKSKGCIFDFQDDDCFSRDACEKRLIDYYGCTTRYNGEYVP